jgi:hypothetical protein
MYILPDHVALISPSGSEKARYRGISFQSGRTETSNNKQSAGKKSHKNNQTHFLLIRLLANPNNNHMHQTTMFLLANL